MEELCSFNIEGQFLDTYIISDMFLIADVMEAYKDVFLNVNKFYRMSNY